MDAPAFNLEWVLPRIALSSLDVAADEITGPEMVPRRVGVGWVSKERYVDRVCGRPGDRLSWLIGSPSLNPVVLLKTSRATIPPPVSANKRPSIPCADLNELMFEEPPELVEIDEGLERVEGLGLSISCLQSRGVCGEEARG